ncbi:MAG: hypothetical protein SNG49_08745 [Rikenellaceae bacterium]
MSEETKKQTVIAIIPAKHHSERCPNKNHSLFCGKPLFLHSVYYAKQEGITPVVSTDSELIINICENEGIDYIREKVNDAEMKNCVKQVLAQRDCDYFAILQPTSPLRARGVLQQMIAISQQSGGESVISVQDHKLVGFVKDKFYAASRDQDCKDRFLFFDGSISIASRTMFEETDSLFSPNIIPFNNPFPCNLQIDTLNEKHVLETLAYDAKFAEFIPSAEPSKVCIISNVKQLQADYSDFVDSCDKVIRVSKMCNLDSDLTGRKTDVALVACWDDYMRYSREERHVNELKKVPRLIFLPSFKHCVDKFVQDEDIRAWEYLSQKIERATYRYSTVSKAIALAESLYPNAQLYFIGDLDVALRTGSTSSHVESGDDQYLKRLIDEGKLIHLSPAGGNEYASEIPLHKEEHAEHWNLRHGLMLFKQDEIELVHASWRDVLSIGKFYARRNAFLDVAKIESFENGEIRIKWDNWGYECFRKTHEGNYRLISSTK